MECPSSHLGIVDISTNTTLGSDWHRGEEMCSLNEPNSLERIREKRRRKLFSDRRKILMFRMMQNPREEKSVANLAKRNQVLIHDLYLESKGKERQTDRAVRE